MRTNKNIKEAQGRANRIEGESTKAKILQLLTEQPLTFGELAEKAERSKPITWKYLERLRKKGLIEKTVKDNKVVYQVVSKERAGEEIKSLFIFLLGYVFGTVSAKSEKSLKELIDEAMKKPSPKPIEIEEVKPKVNGD